MPDPVRRARLSTAAVFLLSGATLGVWATAVPLVRDRLALPAAALGGALLCLALGAFATMPVAGPLTARLGAGPVVRLGVLLSSPALVLAVLSPGYAGLCVALAAFGVGVGLTDVAMNAHAVEVEHAVGRPVLSGLHAMWSLGGLAGSAGGAALLLWLPPPVQAGVVAALCGAGMLWAAGAMFPPHPPVPAAEGAPRPAGLWRRGPLLLAGALMCASFVVEGAMLDWTGVFLHGTRGVAPAAAALGYSAFSVTMVAMRLLGDRVRTRLGGGGVLRLAGLGAAGLAAALLLPGQWGPLAGFALVGVGMANVVPVLFAFAGRQGERPAAAVSVAATLGYAGVLGGPPLLGLVAQGTSVPGALWVVAGLCGGIAAVGGRQG